MSKKFLVLLLLIMGIGGSSAVAQSLVEIDPASVSDGHVYLMDNVGADVPDVSANSNNGNLIGSPQSVAGLNGEALQFNGVDDGVHLPDAATINLSTHQNHTVIAVFNCADVTKSEKQVVYEEGGTTRGLTIYVHEGLVYAGGWNLSDYTPEWTSTHISAPIGSNEWHVVAAVLRGGTAAQEDDKFEMWLDGELIDIGPGGQLNSRSNDNAIGYFNSQIKFHDGNGTGGGGYFEGMVDEVWILNVALSEAELRAIALTRTNAKDPVPEDEDIDISRDGILAWTPGEFAQTHDVYFGTVFDDVNDASRDNPMDMLASQGQADTTFDPGRLEFGQTYYWRVDEVNGAPDNTIFKGETWSFTAELLAYPVQNVIAASNATSPEGEGPENTVNGSGLNELDQHSVDGGDMWAAAAPADGTPVTITFEFERVEKLHEMLVWNYNVQFEPFLGYSFKDVTVEYSADGVDWIVQGDVVFAQGQAVETYTANTAVTFGGVAARFVRLTANTGYGMLGQFGLSEVRFNSIPVHAAEPDPAEGATGVSVSTALSWKAGREAAAHDVSLSTDPNALAPIDTASDAALDPGPLALASTYYWRVDEVNEAETLSLWEGPVWSFATEEFVVVDDFESYDDEENRIFDVWIDGFVNDTGSTVGYFEAPFAETTTTHGGAQSMPLAYDNTGGITISEATRTFDASQDWTQHGIKGLLIWFFGNPDNDAVQMYVKIDDTKIDYDGDTGNLARTPWQLWYVDLTGLNVSNVGDLTIGFEGGGAGTVFIDDIMLSSYDRQLVTPVEPDTANLVAHFAFDGDTSDSTGAHPGAPVGTPIFVDGKMGQAIRLNGTGDYVELTGYKGILGANPITVTAWVNTTNTETGAIIGWGPNVGGQRFGFRIDQGRIRHEHHGGNIQGDTVMNDGTWHHVAITVEANATVSYPEAILWLDGLDDTRPTTDPDPYAIVADLDVRIGSRPAADDRFFMGDIDEVRIYDRVLSPAEIAALAGRTEPFDVPFVAE